MFLVEKHSGDLMRIDDFETLFNPFKKEVLARNQAGEEEQDWMPLSKDQLIFPSGESLPRCWRDPDYRDALRKHVESA